VRAYLVETLRRLNYQVLRAADAAAALEFLQQRDLRVDLLLTDVVMPGTNGRELAKRADALRPGLKVLYVTGYSRNAIVHQGRLDPGVEYAGSAGRARARSAGRTKRSQEMTPKRPLA
jgi:CheY-like chemotaxis protein